MAETEDLNITADCPELAVSNRRTGEPIAVTTAPFDGRVEPGVVHVKTIRDVLANYRARPEAKSLGPDSKPVTRRTRGLLRRRAAENISPAHLIGKEANRIDDRTTGIVQSPAEYRNHYQTSDRLASSLRGALDTFSTSAIAESSGLHRRTIERLRRGNSRPSAQTIRRLKQALQDLTA